MDRLVGLALLAVAIVTTGCAPLARLDVRPTPVVLNQTLTPRAGNAATPASAMLLSAARADASTRSMEREFERSLIRGGVRVVVPAVSGRVVREEKNEAATQLPELERVLIMARNSGADVVIEIEAFSSDKQSMRLFCSDGRSDFVECDSGDYKNAFSGRRFVAHVVSLRARIIDTQNGEVVSLIDLAAPITNWIQRSYDEIDTSDPRRTIDCDTATGTTHDVCLEAAASATSALFDEATNAVKKAPLRKTGPSP